MNALLERILTDQSVTDGVTSHPLRHPDFPDLPVAIDITEGAMLQRLVATIKPRTSLEIGCAYGVSTLFICDALAALPHKVQHIVLDPFQSTQWGGIGLKNVRDAGFGALVDFRERSSELELPSLAREGVTLDFAFVDGRHTFDQVMMEFYFLNRMLRVGGVIVFDDADRRSVNRVVRHALTYPAYTVKDTERTEPAHISTLGRARRALGAVPGIAQIVRPDILHRDWDLGIFGSCVAIQKIADDKRSSGWDAAF
jgi:predicted O-methyltransferase YrrM